MPVRDATADLVRAAVELLGRDGGTGTLRVDGDSMLPTLRPGQTVAADFSVPALRRGDVLVFRRDDFLVVHRLLGRWRSAGGATRLRTRGDGRVALDPRLEPAAVVARVVAVADGPGWRDLRGRGARAYAVAVAWHDLGWAAVAAVARRVEERLVRIGLRPRLQVGVAIVDRTLLRAAHAALFARLHPRIAAPPGPQGPLNHPPRLL